MKTRVGGLLIFLLAAGPAALRALPGVQNVTMSAGSVGQWEKLEISFDVATAAQNFQWPHDSAPPPGVPAGAGVTVDALFSPDGWQTVHTQPAFYYQDFRHETRGTRDWIYPTSTFTWKVRYSPPRAGAWQVKIRVTDNTGSVESSPRSFSVVPSNKRGFVRVSARDPRYFEHDDGTYFPALGYNMNFSHVSWDNPVAGNTANFQAMGQNGIQLARIWLSQWGIFTTAWNGWNSPKSSLHAQYIPAHGVTSEEAVPGSETSMKITWGRNPCMFMGFMKVAPSVKRNTNYRVQVTVKTRLMTAPRDASKPHGFLAKTGMWLSEDTCADPGTGSPVTPYLSVNTTGFVTVTGAWNSGNADFMPFLYLALENTDGDAFVDRVAVEEDLGGGQYGPNIVHKPWMAHHQYFEQRTSFAFDKMLALAEQNNVYLKPVMLEKNELIMNLIDWNGDFGTAGDNNNFYGNYRAMTKVRWLQRAWWRYCQARWGYSPNIHSWELLNEGDPFNGRHYTLADELGKFMRQYAPQNHLVTTSFWHSYPKSFFWDNAGYPNVDYADVHQYMFEGQNINLRIDNAGVPVFAANDYFDTAAATERLSSVVGAKAIHGAGKPIMRGETGFVSGTTDDPTPALLADRTGVWLHNYLWGGISAGGLIESYWNESYHIYNAQQGFDHRPHFGVYSDFFKDIPLSNGHYVDAQATGTVAGLRAWGQKDLQNQRAHLWIQNTAHTWDNVVNNRPIAPLSGQVIVPGLRPGAAYAVEVWSTDPADRAQPVAARLTLNADGAGTVALPVNGLTADFALKLTPAGGADIAPPAAPRQLRRR